MQPTEPIRIALAEDNPVSRKSFLEKAQMIPEWKIVFTASNGHECLEQLRYLKDNMLPQVVFMDIEMPQVNGITTIAMAKALHPQIAFIAFTIFDDDDKIFEAIRAGASGYLLKHEGHLVLQDAVSSVLEEGGAPMSPAIARKTLQMLSRVPEMQKQSTGQLPEHLTAREKEVLQYTVKGWDAKRIALALDISPLTVRKHIANTYQKLHVESRAEILSMAHKNNWLGS